MVRVTLELGRAGVSCTPKQPGSGGTAYPKKRVSENIPAQNLFVFYQKGDVPREKKAMNHSRLVLELDPQRPERLGEL